ncbi:MAG: hypothetical protein FGM54_00460 [Chitinophagaceae bacterium]|nr:hypothetical protein [Chitinophagaceae bacterium]
MIISLPQFKFTTFLVLAFSLWSATLHAETLHYDVVKDSKKVGYFQIGRAVNPGEVVIRSESTVRVSMLFTIEVIDKMYAVFRNNVLHTATIYRTLNGNVRVNNLTQWQNGKYALSTKDDKNNGAFTQTIRFTTVSLYFDEPLNLTEVYSEKFQRMVAIKSIGIHKYQLTLPDGNTAKYTYVNGYCSEVEAQTDWAVIKFVFKEKKV